MNTILIFDALVIAWFLGIATAMAQESQVGAHPVSDFKRDVLAMLLIALAVNRGGVDILGSLVIGWLVVTAYNVLDDGR